LLVLDEHNSIKDVQVNQTVLNSDAFCAGTKGARPDTYQVTVKNNFAALLIAKFLCGVTYVLEDANLNLLEGTDLHTLLIDPLARFMEKHCTSASNANAELVASEILSRTEHSYFQEKHAREGCQAWMLEQSVLPPNPARPHLSSHVLGQGHLQERAGRLCLVFLSPLARRQHFVPEIHQKQA